MNDTEQKRQKLLGAYPSPQWKNKVKAMREDQVQAVYLRLKSANKI